MQQMPPYQMGSSYQFSAQPQVIRTGQQMRRDPYKDFIKIAPQNIMHDRRVVRGNTFAAIVIPTSLQPDPVLAEKQREQQLERKYRMERLRKKREEELTRKRLEDEEQQYERERELEHQNDWEELDDFENMADEAELEPDYYIDKPPTPVFMENEKGVDQEVQVNDKELYDFELEVEPILQVLIGKACENARVEVIEEWEKEQLLDHKKKFLIIKEAELMETQRMEAARNRRRREAERRYANFRTAKGQVGWFNQKMWARLMAKKFMGLFKRDTFQELEDVGILRSPTDHAMQSRFLPALHNQTRAELIRNNEFTEGVDGLIMMILRGNAREHKQSIQKEYKRREEKKRLEFIAQKKKDEERRKRREQRAAAREKARVLELHKKVISSTIEPSKVEEKFEPDKMRVFDVRDPEGTGDGIYLIGGMVVEIMTTFTCLLDYIQANPQNQNFRFSYDSLIEYLKGLLLGNNFPDGAITLHVSEKDEEDGVPAEELDEKKFLRHCLRPSTINDYGLGFFIDICKEMVISIDFIDWFYRAIIKISRTQPQELVEVPTIPETQEDGTPLPEEEKQAIEKQIQEAKTQNEAIEKENQVLEQLKSKIKIEYRDHDYNESNECALIKLSNFREAPKEPQLTESPKKPSERHLDTSVNQDNLDDSKIESVKSQEKEEGTFEDVPPKVILISPDLDDDLRTIIVHTEAQMGLRKLLIDTAKKHFKELEKLDANSVFTHSKNKSELLEERFLEHAKKNFMHER